MKENLDRLLSEERRSYLLPIAIIGSIVFWVAIGLIVLVFVR